MDERRYDAFLSYSHEADRATAVALQQSLQRFGKPWYRARALRVFRDDASLAAEPGLWPAIERALAASDHFILLASPKAARSPWVEREVRYWVQHKPLDRLLIVLTDGDLASTAASPALVDAIREEPRFVDLRWARRGGELDLREPRFQAAVADLAAPLHGRSKDELIGEAVREHRRTVRIARTVVTAVALLAVLAATAALVALDQREAARAQRDRAERQALLATSRLMAETADEQREARLDRALLLAAAASDLKRTPEADGALLDGLASARHARLFLAAPDSSAGTMDPSGALLAIGHEDGHVDLHTVRAPSSTRELSRAGGKPVTAVAFSRDASLVAWGRKDGEVTVARVADGRQLMSGTGGRAEIQALAFTPDGRTLASAPQWKPVDVWSLDGRVVRSLQPRSDVVEVWLAFTANDRLVRTTDAGTTTVWDGWREDSRFALGGDVPFASPTAAEDGLLSPSGDVVLTEWRASRYVWRSMRTGWTRRATDSDGWPIAIADGGERVATVSDGGTVRIWSTGTRGKPGSALRAFRAGFPSGVFSADGRLLFTLDPGAGAVVWGTAGRSPTLVESATVPSTQLAGLRVGPDSVAVAFEGQRGVHAGTVRRGAVEHRAVLPLADLVTGVAAAADGSAIAAVDATGAVHVRRGGATTRLSLGSYGPPQSVELTADGGLLAVSAANHDGPPALFVWDLDGRRAPARYRSPPERMAPWPSALTGGRWPRRRSPA
jgi:WD40 repeat protein